MKWCCPGFKANYEQAGERGAGILVGRDYAGRAEFTLQYRAVKQGDEEYVSSKKPLSLVIDVGMRFCPWCGRDLEKWYDKEADKLYRPNLKIEY